MRYQAIELSDFTFKASGYGHYLVTYCSPSTDKKWTVTTNDMPLIDLTKNEDYPLKKNLNSLKWICKNQAQY
jgi:hypothetical protein